MKPVVFTSHDLNPGRTVAGRDAVVDQGLTLPVGVPPVDVDGPPLGIQHRGDAIHGSILVVQAVLTVRVELDETWRDDQAARIDGLDTAQRAIADGLDFVTDDSNVGDSIEAAFGIHHVTI